MACRLGFHDFVVVSDLVSLFTVFLAESLC